MTLLLIIVGALAVWAAGRFCFWLGYYHGLDAGRREHHEEA